MFVQSIEELHARLKAYIEAVYHVADTRILDQRAALLSRDGVIRQPAFIESTRQYATGDRYDSLLAGSPAELAELADALSKTEEGKPPPLLYNPPYKHQGEALRSLLFDRKDIVVFTGTGSGKTECFTVPILMRLLREAATAKASFGERAIRALVLYPMNALVNDQLSRMRRMFNHQEVVNAFIKSGGRPAKFGQYTGRTPFAGLRGFTADTDGRKMASFEKFYIDTVLDPAQGSPPNADALLLLRALSDRGRWPAKANLKEWFGSGRWQKRLHPQQEDRELVARHEFYGYSVDGKRYGDPPDILITNYSMLEYMMMRPIERSLFERTRAWLEKHRDQDLYLVLDEAHLYRGAQGTEVALLIRRLRERLGLSSPDREHQLRIAVTSASFSASDKAREFAAQLVGRSATAFVAIGGTPASLDEGTPGDERLAGELARTELRRFYASADVAARFDALKPALEYCRGKAVVDAPADDEALSRLVYEALAEHPVRRQLVALTQSEALQIPELAERLFPDVGRDLARRATEALTSLCAYAKPKTDASNLLPSRIHTFHRGLPGLWACANPSCSGGTGDASSVIGALFSQPRDTCDYCSSRVFEFLTCRSCGAAYLRAACAASEIDAPRFLWGQAVTLGTLPPVVALDVLVDVGRADSALTQLATLDVRTGAIVSSEGEGTRRVGFYMVDSGREEPIADQGRRFYRCGVCADENDLDVGGKTQFRSPVEDHQTEGQDPFYALVHEQLMRQPARAKRPAFLKKETPLAGRKVLIFSDGRQKAARLAAELGRAALRDSLRPLVLAGYGEAPKLALRHIYPALLLGAAARSVELRATDERFDDELRRHVSLAREALDDDLDDESLTELRECAAPLPVATLLLRVLRDKHTGLQALALARIAPLGNKTKKKLDALPALPALSTSEMSSFVRLWIGTFVEGYGCTVFTADELEDDFRWLAAKPASGALKGIVKVLGAYGADTVRAFQEQWLPGARDALRSDGDDEGASTISLNALKLTLEVVTADELATWGRCERCSRVQSTVLAGVCVHCQASPTVKALLKDSDAEKQFLTRKRFYRDAALGADDSVVRPLVAREHSAALTGVSGETQSRAERHELAFQDITAPSIDGMRSPIDVLSCTTTMEVGIDIGDLSGVALRNMPPGRANYQQRAGRAGRRGNAVATVLAYADQDGHNQHFFENPRKLIKAAVPDPTLNLENPRIAQRHINAFVLQCFLVDAVPSSDAPDPRTANLFATLGTVDEFLSGSTPLNLAALKAWLGDQQKLAAVRAAIERWLPGFVRNRDDLIETFGETLVEDLERSLITATDAAETDDDENAQQEDLDAEAAPGKSRSLLERLLYVGVLPKYAFPTDLVAFHVFESTFGLNAKATEVRRSLRYAPQRALSLALSEYAPGRTVFIDGRLWVSSGLYSPMPGALARSFEDEEFFRSCVVCGYAELGSDATPTQQPCRSCGDSRFGDSVGTKWVRPPGFVHAVNLKPRTDPNLAQFSRPGRAVLWAPSPPPQEWVAAEGGVSSHLGLAEDWELVVTNRGPRDQGFRVCRSCGAIEPAVEGRLTSDKHRAPYPNPNGFSFECSAPAMDTVSLGTRFKTDVLLLRFQLPEGQTVAPGLPTGVFQMALSSLATALSLAASLTLEIEAGEVISGFRSSFTQDGPSENAVEVFLYDQLAGGAGYVVELSQRITELLAAARAILRHEPWEGRSPQPPCDRACYGCLLSFKNSFEHPLLDRRLALDLLEASRTQTLASLGEERTASSLGMIEAWLRLLRPEDVLIDEPIDGTELRVPLAVRRTDGVLVVPALCHPFSSATPDAPAPRDLLEFGMGSSVEVVPLDQLVVARALPIAMEELRAKLV